MNIFESFFGYKFPDGEFVKRFKKLNSDNSRKKRLSEFLMECRFDAELLFVMICALEYPIHKEVGFGVSLPEPAPVIQKVFVNGYKIEFITAFNPKTTHLWSISLGNEYVLKPPPENGLCIPYGIPYLDSEFSEYFRVYNLARLFQQKKCGFAVAERISFFSCNVDDKEEYTEFIDNLVAHSVKKFTPLEIWVPEFF